MTHSLGRNNFVGTQSWHCGLAVRWLATKIWELVIYLNYTLGRPNSFTFQWWFNSTFLIPCWRKVAESCQSKQLQLCVCLVYSAEKFSKLRKLWFLCLCRFAVLILAALDPYLEMSPGRFQFIIMVAGGGGGRWGKVVYRYWWWWKVRVAGVPGARLLWYWVTSQLTRQD